MKRRTALAAAAVLAGSRADAADKRRLGALLLDADSSWTFFMRDLPPALAGLGWREGRNLAIDWRFADGDAARLPELAAALLRDGADALISRGTPATRALQRATSTVPIVTGVGDPVGAGFAASLAAPGGNITGLSYAQVENVTKQIELLRSMVPAATRLLVLLHAGRVSTGAEMLAVVERLARGQGLEPQLLTAARVDELRDKLRTARERHPTGAVVGFAFSFGGAMDPKDVALAALHAGVPTMFDQRGYVDSGGLMSYRLYWEDQTQRTAVQLAKVLRGENPARIPFELPTRSEFVINATAAKMLELAIPPVLRARADEVVG